MILSDKDIKKYIKEKLINIEPFDINNIKASSIDMTLNKYVKVWKGGKIDLLTLNEEDYQIVDISNGYWLEPGSMVLGSCNEMIAIPDNMCVNVHNRSSFARVGLDVSSSSYANPGYKGTLPLAIFNRNKQAIKIIANMRICQITFNLLTTIAENPYRKQNDKKYYGEQGANIAKLHLDQEIKAFLESKGISKINDNLFNDLCLYLNKKIQSASTEVVKKLKKEFGEDYGEL